MPILWALLLAVLYKLCTCAYVNFMQIFSKKWKGEGTLHHVLEDCCKG